MSPPPASLCAMRNVVVTGGSRGLGLGIVRRLADAGYAPIAVARKEGAELAKIDGRWRDRGGDPVRAVRPHATSMAFRASSRAAQAIRSALWARQQCSRRHRRRVVADAHLADRADGAAQYAVAHRSHQIRGAVDDGGRRRPHHQCHLDRGVDRLQRALGLCRHQGFDGRLHALARARGRHAWASTSTPSRQASSTPR